MAIIRYINNIIHHDRNIRNKLQEIDTKLSELSNSFSDFKIQNRIEQLREKTLNCKEIGISSEKYCEYPIIVSMTTYGERIFESYLAIESIMQGSVKPNRIILWLSEEEFKEKTIPRMLQLLQKRGLEVYYCKDIKSYKKLIPTLKKYPQSINITIDDDVIYEYDLIERFINAHKEKPNAIFASRMHRIRLDENNRPVSYIKWDYCINDEEISPLNFPTGVGGILYPPNCFDKDVLNEDIFMKCCPNADDIWFYVMARKKGTNIIWLRTKKNDGYYYDLPLYSDSLSRSNANPINCQNDIQMNAVLDRYGFIFN